jgi:hypothetical protein
MKKIYSLIAFAFAGFAINAQCTTPPIPICQDITVYLDGSGLFVIDAQDLDNGSTVLCGANLTFSADFTTFNCASISDPENTPSLIISAAYDAGLTGGTPKGIEIYVINDIADLSVYGIGSANNGGGSDGQEFTFPSVSVTAGTYIYVSSETNQFTTFFGFSPDYTSGSMGINGDDAIELFQNANVIDVFGDINTDGNGEAWEYTDGWAYRNNLETPNNGVFNDANWFYSGINALDGETDNASATIPVPVSTFNTPTTLGNAVILTVMDDSNNSATCNSIVTVLDTLPPALICVGATSFALDGTGNFTLTTGDLDNGTTENCGAATLSLSQENFTCNDLGVNTVYLYATDQYGNLDSCSTDVTIQPMNVLSIGGIASVMTTCFGSCDGELTITATNASMYSIDNGVVFQVSNVFPGLCEGSYDVVVMSDAANCNQTVTTTALIEEPAEITTSFIVTDVDCFGNDNGVIDLTTVGGDNTYSFDWDNDGTGDNDDLEDINGLTPAIYHVTITDGNNCLKIDSAEVFEGAVVDLTTSVTGFDIMSNQSGAQSYQWLSCEDHSVINGATNQTYSAIQNGDYEVEITLGTCVDTSECKTISGVGINENSNLIFSVYPNPSNGNIYIDLANNTNVVILSVININGKVVATETTSSENVSFNLTEVENGIYFVQIKTSNDVITKKISITK